MHVQENSFQHERLFSNTRFETEIKATRKRPIMMDFGCLVLPVEKIKLLTAKCERERYIKLAKVIAA